MAQAKQEVTLELGEREVVATSPDKLLLPGVTKLDLVNYCQAVRPPAQKTWRGGADWSRELVEAASARASGGPVLAWQSGG